MSNTKKARVVLSPAQKFDVLAAVKERAAGKTDPDLARELTAELGFPVQAATVASYRESFGIPKTKPSTQAELKVHIAKLEAALLAAKALPKWDDQPGPEKEAA